MAKDNLDDTKPDRLIALTGEIVAAYVTSNPVPVSEVATVLRSVHGMLTSLNGGERADGLTLQKPAVQIKKSVTADYIVCLEDGKRLKMLKRYLRTRYQLTPEQYRHKWGLPIDYPMVAPNYAATRSAFAKKIGLGRGNNKSKKRKRA